LPTIHILDLGGDIGKVVSDFRKIYVLAKREALLHLINRINHQDTYKHLLEGIEEEGLEGDYDKAFYFLGKEPDFIKEFYLRGCPS